MTVLSILLIVTGFFLIIVFTFNSSFNDGSGILDPDLATKYGSLIGGLVGPLFSLAGILLIFENLLVQRKTFYSQQFETKLFELIKYHRENVISLETEVSGKVDKIYGHYAMVEFKENIESILRTVKFYTNENVFEEQSKLKDQIKITYVFFFYGLLNSSLNSKKKVLPEFSRPIDEEYSILDKIFNVVKQCIVSVR